MIEMTPNQREILAHVVEDAEAWYSHAVKEFGPQLAHQFLMEKCKRWEPDYERESKRHDYKARKERDEAEAKAKEAQNERQR